MGLQHPNRIFISNQCLMFLYNLSSEGQGKRKLSKRHWSKGLNHVCFVNLAKERILCGLWFLHCQMDTIITTFQDN